MVRSMVLPQAGARKVCELYFLVSLQRAGAQLPLWRLAGGNGQEKGAAWGRCSQTAEQEHRVGHILALIVP